MHLIGLPVITKADLSSCTSLARIRYLNRFVVMPETCSYATETLGGSQIATIFQESVGSDDADSQDVKKIVCPAKASSNEIEQSNSST